ncbi:MAG: hypothetical protein U9Q15_01055 [Patescibacteria group bacterium]|nr:hypothetical protein [Patescibacteria group bacterium]
MKSSHTTIAWFAGAIASIYFTLALFYHGLFYYDMLVIAVILNWFFLYMINFKYGLSRSITMIGWVISTSIFLIAQSLAALGVILGAKMDDFLHFSLSILPGIVTIAVILLLSRKHAKKLS